MYISCYYCVSDFLELVMLCFPKPLNSNQNECPYTQLCKYYLNHLDYLIVPDGPCTEPHNLERLALVLFIYLFF